jgi:nitrite reductase/ring-hydroxylating ferredoxin subunit
MPDTATTARSNPAGPYLCHAGEVGEGEARGIDLHGEGVDSLFLVRFKSRLYAWRNACPHIDGAPMAWRKDAYMNPAGTHIVCHAHGALFQPDTGLCVQGACLGASLSPVAIEIDEDSVVRLRHRATNKREE